MKDLQHLLEPSHLPLFKKDPEALKKKDQIAYEHFRRLKMLYLKIKDLDKKEAKNVLSLWLAKTIDFNDVEVKYMYHELTQAIKSAKGLRLSLVREFVPATFKFPFTSDGLAQNTNDPTDILRMIFSAKGDPDYKRIRSFEALVSWSLGNRYLLTDLENSKKEGQLSKFVIWLENKLFASLNRTRRCVVDVTYDPENKNRFVRFGKSDYSVSFPVWFRFIKLEKDVLQVMFDARIKQTIDIFRKVLIHSGGEIPTVDDTQGITLVFMDREELESAYEIMMAEIFPNPAAIMDLRIEGCDGKGNNCHSSHIAVPIRQFVAKTFAGTIEVQLILFKDYFNRRNSLGDEIHHLYRLRQVIPLLQMLFPIELYEVDWTDERLLAMMKELQLNRVRVDFLFPDQF